MEINYHSRAIGRWSADCGRRLWRRNRAASVAGRTSGCAVRLCAPQVRFSALRPRAAWRPGARAARDATAPTLGRPSAAWLAGRPTRAGRAAGLLCACQIACALAAAEWLRPACVPLGSETLARDKRRRPGKPGASERTPAGGPRPAATAQSGHWPLAHWKRLIGCPISVAGARRRPTFARRPPTFAPRRQPEPAACRRAAHLAPKPAPADLIRRRPRIRARDRCARPAGGMSAPGATVATSARQRAPAPLEPARR